MSKSNMNQTIEARLESNAEKLRLLLLQLDKIGREISADMIAVRDKRDVSDDAFRLVDSFAEFWTEDDVFLKMVDWANNVTSVILKSPTL